MRHLATVTHRRSRALFTMAAALIVLLSLGGAEAQNGDAHTWLNAAEQKAFAERLSQTHASAERAKIKAEMNRLIQMRKLERRQKSDK